MPRCLAWALALPVLLTGCVTAGSLASGVGSVAGSAASAFVRGSTEPQGSTANSLAGGSQSAASRLDGMAPPSAGGAAGGTPLSTRPKSSLLALFEKGTVNGSELAQELTAVRNLMKDKRSASAVNMLLGQSKEGQQANGNAAVDPSALAFKAAMQQAELLIKPYIASIGFGAFDLHMRTLLEDPKLLLAERINLPSPKGMTEAQMQRVVNMAAILAATRATGKILKKAQEDFANVEADYLKLIGRRENAAQLLYGILTRNAGGSSAGDFGGVYGSDDLRYLRENVGRMSVKDFSNDLGAQNLALRHLRQTDAKAWEDYKALSDGLRSSTKGYIRTTAGITAFAGLLASFGNETMGAVNKNRAGDIFDAFPMGWEFIKEVPPFLKAAWTVGAAGIVELPSPINKRFRVVHAGTSTDVARASEVFSQMKTKGAETEFNAALFRTGTEGLLYKLFRCDKSEVGRMLDTSVPMVDREKFAAKYLQSDPNRFSFANAFNAPASAPRERELGDELLRVDHRERTSAVNGVALGEVQRQATVDASKWNNDQLLRLILANREGVAAHATLQLGDFVVRPVPSMQSVFAYENLIDECSEQFGGGPKAQARAAAAATAAAVSSGQVKPVSSIKPPPKPSVPAVKLPTKPAVTTPTK